MFKILLAVLVSGFLMGCSAPSAPKDTHKIEIDIKTDGSTQHAVLQYEGAWSMYEWKEGSWHFVVRYPDAYKCLKEKDELNNENKGIFDCMDH